MKKLCALLLLLSPASLLAWGGVGHRIVGGIAEQRLENTAALKVALELLEGKHFSEVASEPDELRKNPGLAHTGAWHFVNIPLAKPYLASRDCAFSDCIIDRITQQRTVLADKNQSTAARRDALIFLIHFLGDIHQPLHCEQGLLKDGSPDRGGNLVHVTLNGKHLNGIDDKSDNLHSFWDVTLVENGDGKDDKAQVARLLTMPIPPADGTPKTWAFESKTIAKGVQVADGTDLTDAYIVKNKPKVDKRLLQAGVRLAAVIEKALGSQ
ncbi:MAG TPA: S1/P1 nuclease [Thermoanaerobaculia bacterium]|nr:S1/P1 nuclease [Thermoanaerobaculia bacterium]